MAIVTDTANALPVSPPAEGIAALPEYPEMKPLELEDREAMEACTRRVPCSSDHNFTSLWMWNVDESAKVARIGTNLVVEFADYETHEPRLTLIGEDDIPAAAEQALSFGADQLDFVPEFVAEQLSPSRFLVERDRDQDDYVFGVDLVAKLGGKRFRYRRREAFRCERGLGDAMRVTTSPAPIPDADLFDLFDRWRATRGKEEVETRDERRGVERLVSSWDGLDVLSHCLFDGEVLVATLLVELLPDGAIGHCMKADASYDGVFPLLLRSACEALDAAGVRELNMEQDLGLPGLREAKTRFHPVRYVRKYKVQIRRN